MDGGAVKQGRTNAGGGRADLESGGWKKKFFKHIFFVVSMKHRLFFFKPRSLLNNCLIKIIQNDTEEALWPWSTEFCFVVCQ